LEAQWWVHIGSGAIVPATRNSGLAGLISWLQISSISIRPLVEFRTKEGLHLFVTFDLRIDICYVNL
jgi:hypothetical protein